jgi:hypothetical protein
MIETRRLGPFIALPFTVGLLAACGSSTTGNVTAAAAVTSTPASTTAPKATPTAAPAQPPRTAPPQPTSSVNRGSPGPFGGSWKAANGATLNVSSDESANASYFIGVLCSSATPTPSPCDDDSGSPTIPGGQLKLQVTEVVTTGGVAVASADVRDSSDPKYPEGSTIKFTLKNGVITSPIGTFTKVPSSD